MFFLEINHKQMINNDNFTEWYRSWGFWQSRNAVYLVFELIPHDVYDVTEKGPYIQMPRLSS